MGQWDWIKILIFYTLLQAFKMIFIFVVGEKQMIHVAEPIILEI